MSGTSENAVLSTKENNNADPTAQEVDNAEPVIPPQQADIAEQIEVAQ